MAESLTVRDRAQAYQAVFRAAKGRGAKPAELSPPAVTVLRDLARVCCVNRSTFAGDVNRALVNEGRRQVWLHMQTMLSLTDDQTRQLTTDTESPI